MLAGRLAGRTVLSCSGGCTQWKQLIALFYGERGRLRDDNRALSLEMSAIQLRDCPTGQRGFLWKPRYKMNVENITKLKRQGRNIHTRVKTV